MCNCTCHIFSTKSACGMCSFAHTPAYAAVPPPGSCSGPGCPVCEGFAGPSHGANANPVVTANNIWRIVESVTEVDDPNHGARRYTLRLRGETPLQASQFGIIVSHNELTSMKESLRGLFAMHLNKEFAAKGWPPYLQYCMALPETQAASMFGVDMLWSKPDEGNGVYKTVYVGGQGAMGDVVHGSTVTSALLRHIPGLRVRVECPAKPCRTQDEIVRLVQHVNDRHQWTRERIADWLETLDVDLSFPAEPPPPEPKLPYADPAQHLFIIAPNLEMARYESRRRRRSTRDWTYVGTDPGSWYRLQGQRGAQFTCYGIAYPALREELRDLLACAEARQVGDEEVAYLGPGVYIDEVAKMSANLTMSQSMADLMKNIYAPIIKEQAKANDTWVKFFEQKAYQPSALLLPGVWKDDVAFKSSPVVKGYDVIWYDEPDSMKQWIDLKITLTPEAELEADAKKLLDNLSALKHTPCFDNTLWLADPAKIGEYLTEKPPTADTPVQGGHALLPPSDSWTKFTKPNWKKEH